MVPNTVVAASTTAQTMRPTVTLGTIRAASVSFPASFTLVHPPARFISGQPACNPPTSSMIHNGSRGPGTTREAGPWLSVNPACLALPDGAGSPGQEGTMASVLPWEVIRKLSMSEAAIVVDPGYQSPRPSWETCQLPAITPRPEASVTQS